MLKCPRCKKHTAYKALGYADNGRQYSQKRCRSCGFEGQRKNMRPEIPNARIWSEDGTSGVATGANKP